MSSGTPRTPNPPPTTTPPVTNSSTGSSTTTQDRGDGDHNTTSSSTARVLFKGTEIDDHLDKLLECPVCYDVILPPIVSCVQGHSCCDTCRHNMQKCPVCRGEFSDARNLFAEQFLEQCQFKCKHGCTACLPAKNLVAHYKDECAFRPIHCRECDRMIPFDDFLQHVELVDKLERQLASECSTGFEIDEDDLAAHPISPIGHRVTVWEPTWMNCYDNDYFCSLDFNGEHWWIWVACLNDEGRKYKSQIILWSKLKQSEHSYFGTIHSVRTKPDAVLASGECLILTETALKNFMCQGGIDVLVRIEKKYAVPKTRKGVDVQSPLEIMTPPGITQRMARERFIGPGNRAERFMTLPGPENGNRRVIVVGTGGGIDRDELNNNTIPTARRGGGVNTVTRHESRIPVSVVGTSSPQTATASEQDPTVSSESGGATSDDINTTSSSTHNPRRLVAPALVPITYSSRSVSPQIVSSMVTSSPPSAIGDARDGRYRLRGARGYRHRFLLRSQGSYDQDIPPVGFPVPQQPQ